MVSAAAAAAAAVGVKKGLPRNKMAVARMAPVSIGSRKAAVA